MYDKLKTYLEKYSPLSEEDMKLVRSVYMPRKVKKGEFLLREGELVNHAYYVCAGFLRSYVIDNKGKEHIVQFAPEDWWISAGPGVKPGTISTLFIDAIEDSELLVMDGYGHSQMMEKVAAYSSAFLAGIQKRGESKEKRIVNSLSSTAEERYSQFLSDYPGIAQRVPQHMLASYLGITPETVSRIRRKSLLKK